MEAVAEALSSGVAWDDLGELKPEARKLKWNKSSWGRSLPSLIVPQMGEAPSATTMADVDLSTLAFPTRVTDSVTQKMLQVDTPKRSFIALQTSSQTCLRTNTEFS